METFGNDDVDTTASWLGLFSPVVAFADSSGSCHMTPFVKKTTLALGTCVERNMDNLLEVVALLNSAFYIDESVYMCRRRADIQTICRNSATDNPVLPVFTCTCMSRPPVMWYTFSLVWTDIVCFFIISKLNPDPPDPSPVIKHTCFILQSLNQMGYGLLLVLPFWWLSFVHVKVSVNRCSSCTPAAVNLFPCTYLRCT